MSNPVARRTAPGEDESWARTRAMTAMPTQLMNDEEAYLATTSKAIGRRIDDEQHELFVVCDPAEAMLQQFEHHLPDFITLHDLGLDNSTRLLRGVARATQRKVQKLVVRRQGFGVPLATLLFVELPGPEASAQVRIYSTQIEVSDESQRTELAKVLLGHSRLGVILVGPGAATQNAARLQPLSDAMYDANWRNRQLLWLPIGADAASAPPSSLGARRSVVQVHSAPPTADLAHAWPLISSLWDQLRAGGPVDANIVLRAPSSAEPAAKPPAPATRQPYTPSPVPSPRPMPEPLPLRPMPATLPAKLSDETTDTGLWRDYIRECAAIPGMVSCCVFEVATQRPLAHAGTRPGAAALASRGAALFETLCSTGRALGLDPGQPDLALTLAEHHLILHPLAQYPGLLLHAVLDAHVANLTLVRMKLHRLDPGEHGPPHG
ncbi:hypothetical protein [Aquabacterium sp.]|uniref:hypothetical protein n=1 Tax=Aquabacterium sp. TaxID=1872578 RepID=UPI002CE9C229|nr:hypothetical protein [Aquabacterium sp.]HSW08885.1 hypothetical protein [Aquabacterium sp.]